MKNRIKYIEGTDSTYVTDTGDVLYSSDKIRFSYKPRINNSGYGRVRIKVNGQYKELLVHRLVAIYYVENAYPRKYTLVNHIDGNKLNNHYLNLEWCNNKKNMIHASQSGLLGKKKKIDKTVIQSIKSEYTGKYGNIQQLCKKYRLSRYMIKNIVLDLAQAVCYTDK